MSPASFAHEYFSFLDTAHAGIAGASSAVLDGKFPDRLERWLRILYGVIRATTPLLQFCLRTLERFPPDEFIQLLRGYMRHRLEDEADHDSMLLDDLAKVGISKASLDEELPPAAIVAMVGSQYYLVDQFHPAVHLGYIGLLEGYPPQLQDVALLVDKSGAPSEAWSTYRLHAELDPDHRRELVKILDAVPAQAWLRRAIIANGIRCAEHYCQALEEIAATGS
jgi:hypothetical protein